MSGPIRPVASLGDPARTFPTLTPAQMARIAAHGHLRRTQAGEVLIDQGDKSSSLFVVTAGALEAVRPAGGAETLITLLRPGQFTGETNMISGRRSVARLRVTEPGEVIELERERVLALIQTDAELSE